MASLSNDIYQKNIELIRSSNSALVELIDSDFKHSFENQKKITIKYSPKLNLPIPIVNGKKIHSYYDPFKEAKRIADRIDISINNVFIFSPIDFLYLTQYLIINKKCSLNSYFYFIVIDINFFIALLKIRNLNFCLH